MSKIRVALIEDHDLTRGYSDSVATAARNRSGGEAANAHEGLNYWRISHPDIAIVDIGLPDKDGIELTRQIKSAQRMGARINTKVLILTLRDNKEAVLAALQRGRLLLHERY